MKKATCETSPPTIFHSCTFHCKTVSVNNKIVWDRTKDDGFPQTKELKQRMRDILAPSKYLGHSDTKLKDNLEYDDDDDDSGLDGMNDEDAEEMRRFYGVM